MIAELLGNDGPLAASVPDSDGVYVVPAFAGLGAPHWDAAARGLLAGLTRGTTRAHLARAALEAMAYSSHDVLVAMAADSGIATTELRVDGGATTNDWLMRFQAGILGIPVRRPEMVETTALGAAGLAGIHAGVWEDAPAFLEAFGAQDISDLADFTPNLEIVSPGATAPTLFIRGVGDEKGQRWIENHTPVFTDGDERLRIL